MAVSCTSGRTDIEDIIQLEQLPDPYAHGIYSDIYCWKTSKNASDHCSGWYCNDCYLYHVVKGEYAA